MKLEGHRFPRWASVLLSLGGAWAAGIYIDKMTLLGASVRFLLPACGFGGLALATAYGAIRSS
jgi:hypothetical protein